MRKRYGPKSSILGWCSGVRQSSMARGWKANGSSRSRSSSPVGASRSIQRVAGESRVQPEAARSGWRRAGEPGSNRVIVIKARRGVRSGSAVHAPEGGRQLLQARARDRLPADLTVPVLLLVDEAQGRLDLPQLLGLPVLEPDQDVAVLLFLGPLLELARGLLQSPKLLSELVEPACDLLALI